MVITSLTEVGLLRLSHCSDPVVPLEPGTLPANCQALPGVVEARGSLVHSPVHDGALCAVAQNVFGTE